jgi:hypothetical protein
MKLTQNFTLQELTRSAKAQSLGIDNALPPQLLGNVQSLAEMLERVRDALGGKPLIVTSGYRCRELNKAVGGVTTSDHIQGCAADVLCPSFGTPYAMAKRLASQLDRLGIGQMALEGIGGKSWLHLSTRIPARAADRVITITDAGAQLGIQPLA